MAQTKCISLATKRAIYMLFSSSPLYIQLPDIDIPRAVLQTVSPLLVSDSLGHASPTAHRSVTLSVDHLLGVVAEKMSVEKAVSDVRRERWRMVQLIATVVVVVLLLVAGVYYALNYSAIVDKYERERWIVEFYSKHAPEVSQSLQCCVFDSLRRLPCVQVFSINFEDDFLILSRNLPATRNSHRSLQRSTRIRCSCCGATSKRRTK